MRSVLPRTTLCACLAALLFVFATNVWKTFPAGIEYVTSHDVYSYSAIAESAPALPETSLPYHHAQRLVAPYVVGVLAHVTSVEPGTLFRVFGWAFILITCFVFLNALHVAGVGERGALLGVPVWILNPYAIRYYLITPGMLTDQLFVFGLVISLYALVRVSSGWLFTGFILAALGRQTADLMLPGVVVWIFYVRAWNPGRSLSRPFIVRAIALTVIFIVVYAATGAIAGTFSEHSNNLRSVTLLSQSLLGGQLGFTDVLEIIARVLMPVVPLAGILAGVALNRRRLDFPEESLAAFFLWACIIAQPILAGPGAGANGGRLGALGLLPFLYATILIIQHNVPDLFTKVTRTHALMIILLLMAGSMHHMYSLFGPPDALSFAMSQIVISFILATLVFAALRASPGITDKM